MKIDIVAAALNSASYIDAMIQSVLKQNVPDVKLYIQDGGSTDSTRELLNRYPISWKSQPDTGIAQALNRAITATSGEIIGFILADDLMEPDSIRTAVEFLCNNPNIVMVYGDCYVIDLFGNVVKRWKSRPFSLDYLLWGCYIPFQTVYIRRGVINEIGYFNEKLRTGLDYEYWLRLGACFGEERIHYIPKYLGCYRFRETSLGNSNLLLTAKETFDSAKTILDLDKISRRLKLSYKRAYVGIYVQQAGIYAEAKCYNLAIASIKKALQISFIYTVLTRKGILTAIIIAFRTKALSLRRIKHSIEAKNFHLSALRKSKKT